MSSLEKKIGPVVIAAVIAIIGILLVNSMAISAKAIPIYYHNEATTLGGVAGQTLKTIPGDNDGFNETISCVVVPKTRTLFNRTYYPLNVLGSGIIALNTSTTTVKYRAILTNDTARVLYSIDIDVLFANGTVRQNIDDQVGISSALDNNSTWSTLTASYAVTEYTVLDVTDYVRVEWYGNVTTNCTAGNALLRYDDSSVYPVTLQTGIYDISVTYYTMSSGLVTIIDILFIVMIAVVMLVALGGVKKGKR